jgi:hypothetical protein
MNIRKLRIQRDPEANNSGGSDTPIAVDLDALSRPEGAVAMPGEGEQIDITSLPNLDNKLDKEMGNTENAPDPIVDNANKAAEPDPSKQTPQVDQSINTKFHTDILTKMKAKYGEDFELPKDTNADNFYEKIEDAIAYINQPNLHPEVIKMQKAIDAGVDPEAYIKKMTDTSSVTTMEADALVRLSLKQNFGKTEKRPNGWDDAKIDETIKKMDNSGLLEIEAEKIRTKYVEEKEQLAEKMTTEAKLAQQEQMNQMHQEREGQIKETLGEFTKMNDVLGIQLSQSDKAEFAENFRYLVTPDQKTGVAPLVEMLQSNENLAKVAYLLSKGDSKVREALSVAKESGKKSFKDKLDPEPRVAKKSGTHNASEIDLDALAAPERV